MRYIKKGLKFFLTEGMIQPAVSLIIFSMIIGVGISVLVSEKKDFSEALLHKGYSLARFLAEAVPPSLLVYDISMLDNYVKKITHDEEVIYAGIFGEAGEPISISPEKEKYQQLNQNKFAGTSKVMGRWVGSLPEVIEVVEPIFFKDQKIGEVRIGLTTLLISKRLNQESIAVFIMIFVGFLFAYWRLSLAKKGLEKKVKERTQELEAFVYSVSHDLKSPLVSMQGMASMFLDDYRTKIDEKGKHYLERIVSNAQFMEDLIKDLLIFSRIGKEGESLEKGNIQSVIQEIVDIHKDSFSKGNIEVVVQKPLPPFEYDRVQLTQLFQNLITNASKFIGDQPQPRIEIGGRKNKKGVEFYVKDNGIGISPEYHDKIFAIFQRLKEVKAEGTGVGLSIVKKIVDLAGGTIRVESIPGKGAVFYVYFPDHS